jgi:hypothetical protein
MPQARPCASHWRGARQAGFTTNPAGSAIVNALGPIRQVVEGDAAAPRRYLIIAPGTMSEFGRPVQVQAR